LLTVTDVADDPPRSRAWALGPHRLAGQLLDRRAEARGIIGYQNSVALALPSGSSVEGTL
jgi:hypothetical protein